MLQIGGEEIAKHTLLRLERISDENFRGECDSETPAIRAFGGQVLAQALACAYLTVEDGFHLAGLHCYFIRGAEEKKSIVYKPKVLRNGRNFCVLRIDSTQFEKPIVSVDFLFQRCDISQSNPRAVKFPSAASIRPPEELRTWMEERDDLLADGVEPLFASAQRIDRFAPHFELRPCDPLLFVVGVPGGRMEAAAARRTPPPKQYFWVRYKIPVEDRKLSHCVLVAMSDLAMSKTATLILDPPKAFNLITTLDHSLWIHDFDINPNEWILCEVECLSNGCDRSLVRGKIWSRDGRLLAASVQDVLVQVNPDSEDGSDESSRRIAAFHTALRKNVARRIAKL